MFEPHYAEAETLELVDDLTMMVLTAKYGLDNLFYTEENGDQKLLPHAVDYYLAVSEDIEDRLGLYQRQLVELSKA